MTFAQAALRLGGLCNWVLRWTPDVFWNATPDELAACLRDPADPWVAADASLLKRLQEMYPDG